jgi:hypothetical protein
MDEEIKFAPNVFSRLTSNKKPLVNPRRSTAMASFISATPTENHIENDRWKCDVHLENAHTG